jgi:hypothetical protein
MRAHWQDGSRWRSVRLTHSTPEVHSFNLIALQLAHVLARAVLTQQQEIDLQDGGVPHETPCRPGSAAAHAKGTIPTTSPGAAHAGEGFGGDCQIGARRACDPVGFLNMPPLPPLRTQYASRKARVVRMQCPVQP